MTSETVQIRLLKLARNGINWDTVIDHLLQTKPELVLDAILVTQGGEGWEQRVIDFAKDYPTNKVAVIKFAREVYKEYHNEFMGLKDAKEWVENNCSQWNGGYTLTASQFKTPAYLLHPQPYRSVPDTQVSGIENYTYSPNTR